MVAERAAGTQGEPTPLALQIITELPPDHPVSTNGSPLKDTLGHTPLQVGGGGDGRLRGPACCERLRHCLRGSSCATLWMAGCWPPTAPRRCTVQVAVGFVVGVLVGYLVGLAYSL